MTDTSIKKIRVTDRQWKRLEEEAVRRNTSPNRLVLELALEALERRKWPRTAAEILLFRSAVFSAQVLARNMMAEG